MARNTFDAVLASTPQGATAGRVTSKGTHWTPDRQYPPGLLRQSHPPTMRRYDAGRDAGIPDLTGRTIGRLTIIGWLDGKLDRWVVRCACGIYGARRTKVLTTMIASPPPEEAEGATPDRCEDCRALQQIKWKYRNEGARPVSDFFVSVKS